MTSQNEIRHRDWCPRSRPPQLQLDPAGPVIACRQCGARRPAPDQRPERNPK